MKRTLTALLLTVASMTAYAGGGLDGFLADLNIKAKADLPGFSTSVSAQFGLPVVKVNAVIGGVSSPAEAFMVLHLASISHKSPEYVLSTYQNSGGKGWGELAKSLGIKPGSPEFHALKNGELHYDGGKGHSHAASSGGGSSSKKGGGKSKDVAKSKGGNAKNKN